MTTKEMEQWIKDEIVFITKKASNTFNAKMEPEYYSCDAEGKELSLKFPILDWEVNGIGFLHGGVLGTMMDFTMCMMVGVNLEDVIAPTVSQTINFIRPVKKENGVIIKASLTSLGKSTATTYSEAIDPESGKICATSVGTYHIVDKPNKKYRS